MIALYRAPLSVTALALVVVVLVGRKEIKRMQVMCSSAWLIIYAPMQPLRAPVEVVVVVVVVVVVMMLLLLLLLLVRSPVSLQA